MTSPGTELAQAILDDLQDYDGRSVAILGEVSHRHRAIPHYHDALFEVIEHGQPVDQDAATWLLKDSIEKDRDFDTEVSKRLAGSTHLLRNWAAKLHVCQLIRYLTFESEQARALAVWVQPLLGHKRPFVRAWALDAIVHLASFDRGLLETARKALEGAGGDDAASVRARARNLTLD